jgi:divalent metal cation (Fe/Co/Zn/Cd) transporter
MFAAAWNILEAVLAILAGGLSGSAALLSFGLGSLAELATTGVALRELRHGPATWMHTALCALFGGVSIAALLGALFAFLHPRSEGETPALWAIVVAAVSAMMMIIIGLMQRLAGFALRSQVLLAHAKMSFLDSGLALSVLIGLILWSAFGIPWADGVAALVVSIIASREAIEVYKERPGRSEQQ